MARRRAAQLASAADRPNILFIFTDDQASWTVGAHGHPHAKTPHMDRLIREGANLANSFTVTPVCSPSRASLMTSRYGSELGITDWLHPRNEPRWGSIPSIRPSRKFSRARGIAWLWSANGISV